MHDLIGEYNQQSCAVFQLKLFQILFKIEKVFQINYLKYFFESIFYFTAEIVFFNVFLFQIDNFIEIVF